MPSITKTRTDTSALSPEHALAQVEHICRCDKQDFYTVVRGRSGNPARAVAAWWLIEGAGISHSEAAKVLQMSNRTLKRAVTRVRVEGVRRPDGDIVKWSNALKEQHESIHN